MRHARIVAVMAPAVPLEPDAPPPADVTATFCATIVDELVRNGVTHAFVSPGSRSTPMALAIADEPRVHLAVHHDERSAAFAALGCALATARPAVVLTTSGTAAVELHAAVVEAHQARVPMLVLTADRPPELRDVGAPQTVDQAGLYGSAVRWFADAGVPDWSARHAWRSLAARAARQSMGGTGASPSGPVHVNLPFREPLLGTPSVLPPGRRGGAPWHGRALPTSSRNGGVLVDRRRRGVVVAGRGATRWAREITALGWPVIADPRSQRTGVTHADALLRVERLRDALRPQVVLRVGDPPASRIVNEWLDGCGATQIVVNDGWIDPARVAAEVATSFRVGGTEGAPRGWRNAWERVDAVAADAIAERLDARRELSEPGIARSVMRSLPPGAHLVVASSMPVRDLEWYAHRREDVVVHANRGANGIDGVVSTAVGVAAAGVPTVALVGDVAFVHDSTALVALARRAVDLTVVVVDNDGGGIFSFLPQADALDGRRFETLFGTPHGTDCVALAAAHGVRSSEVRNGAALVRAVHAPKGARVVVVRTDRAANVEVHQRLNAAVAAAVASVRIPAW
jgi:2-succinyl-5-enolpyruvyl-6-hydroxy-3-cyclohexene-1-carboxylate synthase